MDDVADCAPGDETPPGAYMAVFTEGLDADLASIAARRMGLVLRDTILVVGPERVSFVLFFKRASGRTVAGDAEVGVGGLNISACRVGTYVNPNGFEGYERRDASSGWGMKASKNGAGEVNAEQQPVGRWPPNVLLVEGPLVRRLDEEARRFFPLFASLDEAHAWVARLLTLAEGAADRAADTGAD